MFAKQNSTDGYSKQFNLKIKYGLLSTVQNQYRFSTPSGISPQNKLASTIVSPKNFRMTYSPSVGINHKISQQTKLNAQPNIILRKTNIESSYNSNSQQEKYSKTEIEVASQKSHTEQQLSNHKLIPVSAYNKITSIKRLPNYRSQTPQHNQRYQLISGLHLKSSNSITHNSFMHQQSPLKKMFNINQQDNKEKDQQQQVMLDQYNETQQISENNLFKRSTKEIQRIQRSENKDINLQNGLNEVLEIIKQEKIQLLQEMNQLVSQVNLYKSKYFEAQEKVDRKQPEINSKEQYNSKQMKHTSKNQVGQPQKQFSSTKDNKYIVENDKIPLTETYKKMVNLLSQMNVDYKNILPEVQDSQLEEVYLNNEQLTEQISKDEALVIQKLIIKKLINKVEEHREYNRVLMDKLQTRKSSQMQQSSQKSITGSEVFNQPQTNQVEIESNKPLEVQNRLSQQKKFVDEQVKEQPQQQQPEQQQQSQKQSTQINIPMLQLHQIQTQEQDDEVL